MSGMSPDPVGPRELAVTSENAASIGPFSEHRKLATTWISDFTMPPGTTYQMPEGLRAEDEETRIAFDVQGGAYPIRESVFQASYAGAILRASNPSDDLERLRRQNHEHAEKRDQEMANLQRQVDCYRNAYERAKEQVHGSPVDWSKDPKAQEPNGWWSYTSQNNRDVLMAAILDSSDDLGAAWAEVEVALPEGAALVRLTWRIGMHEKFPPDEDFEARAEWWYGNDRPVESAYGDSPAAALHSLAARLGEKP